MIKTKKRLQELYRKGSKFKYTALSSVRDKLAEYSDRAEVSPGKMFTILCTTVHRRQAPKKRAQGNAIRMTTVLEKMIKIQTSSRHPKFVKK